MRLIQQSLSLFADKPDVEIAFNDYLNLGPERSVLSLYRKYTDTKNGDSHAVVPCSDLKTLVDWEQKFNWRTLAYQWDAEGHTQYVRKRKEALETVYDSEIDYALEAIVKGKQGLEALDPTHFSPTEALKFMVEATRLRREATERKLALEDPNAGMQSADFLDNVRNLVLNMTQQNNYGQPKLPQIPPIDTDFNLGS